MPGKSRRQKEKKVFKPVVGSGQPIVSVIPPAINVSLDEPAAGEKSSPARAASVTKSAIPAASYVSRELLTITLVAGIMLAVVIVMAILLG